uniref:Sulfotransferase domain-containing protein n=1 Tax=Ditylum brightwellii TaxID=49249 RepID=A0A7S2EMF7_9STRA|mmetsp:Transcript_36322/g.54214  ORF Transcript_36322/g.54214 Transcript_36322/m.54214 type:complete len:311 (+) Transcript_36322:468-1400(+)
MGFPKCGTTFLYKYLNTSESFILREEHCEMGTKPNKIKDLVFELHHHPHAGNLKMGIKCPREVETEYSLANYGKFFPNADFIVTTRHPVEWFESFYNFIASRLWPNRLPRPEDLIGPCQFGGNPYVCTTGKDSCPIKSRNLCTDRGKFHHALSRFGKTPMSTEREINLLNHHNMSISTSKAKIFLVELNQLNEEIDPIKGNIFRNDLRDFLGLKQDLPPMIPTEKKRKERSDERHEFFINICDAKHAALRHVLLQHGRDASDWIREFFIHSPDVVVSSPDYFVELLRRWGQDPCDGGVPPGNYTEEGVIQ